MLLYKLILSFVNLKTHNINYYLYYYKIYIFLKWLIINKKNKYDLISFAQMNLNF